jgi:cysteine desulfurase
MGKYIYFDHAAATPMDSRVRAVMRKYLQNDYYNPSALYLPARRVRDDIEFARSRVAKILGANPYEIIFTAGATESINMVFHGLLNMDSNVVISAVEHEAVREAANQYFSGNVKVCSVDKNGIISIEELKRLVDKNTVLVSVMYVNNEIGTIEPLKAISDLIKNERKSRIGVNNVRPIYFHTDASQAPNYLPVNVNKLGVDLLTLNGGKIYGPKQSGCLYIRKGIQIKPIIVGGGQERGLRSGTENVAAIMGFSEALSIANQNMKEESKQATLLREYVLNKLKTNLSDLRLNGSIKNRIANNLNVVIPNVSGEMLVHYLDSENILIATGAACSADKNDPSQTLLSIGLSIEEANSSIRISFGKQNTVDDAEKLVSCLSKVVNKISVKK